ncbi:class III signal peptide-containing protein [Candidatus Micrarchaeota archaeon]|nr:class III signal peptide-containing protein [Candidatus Micrarchaeota archaeon]
MDQKGQTSIEYIMLIAAVIFLVIVVFFVVKDKVFGSSQSTIGNNSGTIISTIRNVSNG